MAREGKAATLAPINPREAPAYPLAEAARCIRLAPATLRSWVAGRAYPRRDGQGHFRPLISVADSKLGLLSFANLVEAHVLRSLRIEHRVSLKAVRRAIDYAEKDLGVSRLLLRPELRTEAGDLLLERYGELINLAKSGQLAMKQLLNAHLRRIEWDGARLPVRLYPFVLDESGEAARIISIDPTIQFGRPVVASRGIKTSTLAERINSGETPDELATDYGLDIDEIGEAVLYERAA